MTSTPQVESHPVRDYQIRGMTCDHCRHAVAAEIGAIPGVRSVVVDLATGRVTVGSDRPIAVDAIRAAVDEAGYTLG